ncbi:cysteine desulfurase [Rouxiella silvae]|uniref:cysteine desulfurase n=1 Tax=Rouxiella silvae TaxID=1646373 RepID=A0AA40WZU5_9GAMM|nr:cysteine desulfurase family protein [Rouxiella silvae]KQN51366.1 cysteine desulfurase IscS [Serratia sp. Leaf50]MBF6635889.1 cysteine desulfurase [Rouxiella silvae]
MIIDNKPIYFDNIATTRLDPKVLESMMPYLTLNYGNASSKSHVFGWEALSAVEYARNRISKSINAHSLHQIVFTSGATESINLAIRGLKNKSRGGHIITSTIEHKAVLDSCSRLESEGIEVTYLPPRHDGIVLPASVAQALREDTFLVSIMAANNEIGTIQKIEEIGKICLDKGIVFHTDATQVLGKVEFDVQRMNIDLASFSAHKIYGPKGVGALYINNSTKKFELTPLMVGGGHEEGLRSGTLNVPGIVGFGYAAELAILKLSEESNRLRMLKKIFLENINIDSNQFRINGHQSECLPGLLNISFLGVDAESLLLEIPEVALSSGSACTSRSDKPSHVLKEIGVNDVNSQSSVRIGFGRFNHEDEVSYLCLRMNEAVKKLRSMVPHSISN